MGIPFAIMAVVSGAGVAESPKMLPAAKRMAASMIPQIAICKNPTSEMPMIFPIISWKGFTEETISSTMRFVFSYMTLCMTMPPYLMTNM